MGMMLCRLCTLLLLSRPRVLGLRATADSRTVVVQELGSVRSPGIGIQRRYGFRGGCDGYGWCSRFRANFRPGPKKERNFSATRSGFPVTSLHCYSYNYFNFLKVGTGKCTQLLNLP
jgi:hypothetical protein